MRQFWKAAALAAAVAVATPTAQAQTAPAWNGFYAGLTVGGRFAVNDWTTTGTCPTAPGCASGPGPDAVQSFDSAGFRIGGYAGHNWQLAPRWLVGLEGDFGWASNRRTKGPIPGTTLAGGLPSNTSGDSAFVNLSWDASLRARLGALAAPNTLLFVTGGAALQRVESGATCGDDGATTYCTIQQGTNSSSSAETLLGWTVGAGVEYMLEANWMVRLEYRYADFGNASPAFFNFNDNSDDRVFANIRVRTHTVSLGAAYKF